MRTMRLTLCYDGTDFLGWQVQPQGRTVQGEVERALETIHGEQCRITGSGRTDTGVHAAGQVASFQTSRTDFPVDRYSDALNANLPRDVRVLDARPVPEQFNARFSALRRVYRYRWALPGAIDPRAYRYKGLLRRQPSIRRLNELACVLTGTHDFSTFTLPSESSPSRVRTIEQLAFFPLAGDLVMQIAANAFLWRMVRLVAGTLLQAEERGESCAALRGRVAAGTHDQAGPPVDARGLTLERVIYGEDGA